MNDTEKIDKPIYITVPSLKKLLDLLGTKNLSRITVGDLVSRGFAKSVGFQAIQGLRFLGIVDSEGNTTDKARILSMQGSGKNEQLESLVRTSYKKLFDTVPNAETLSKKELHDEFMAIYDMSGRLADTAAPAFLWLSSLAGLKVTEVIEVNEKRAKTKRNINRSEQKPVAQKDPTILESPYNKNLMDSSQHYIDLNIAKSGIRLLIPRTPELEDAVAVGEIKEIHKEISEFAKKHGLVKEDLPTTDKKEDSADVAGTG